MASDDPTIVWIWATRARAMAVEAGWPDEPFGERLGTAIAGRTVRARLGLLKGRKRHGDPDPNSPELAERLKFWLDVKWEWPQAFARHYRMVPYDPTPFIVDYGVSVELVEEDVQRLLGLVPMAKVVTPEGVPSPVPMVEPPAPPVVEEVPARRSKDYQVERALSVLREWYPSGEKPEGLSDQDIADRVSEALKVKNERLPVSQQLTQTSVSRQTVGKALAVLRDEYAARPRNNG